MAKVYLRAAYSQASGRSEMHIMRYRITDRPEACK